MYVYAPHRPSKFCAAHNHVRVTATAAAQAISPAIEVMLSLPTNMSLTLDQDEINSFIAVGVVNYAFSTPFSGILRCLSCELMSQPTQKSDFWKSGVSCPNGHSQEIEVAAASESVVEFGICSDCEMGFVFGVGDRELPCNAEGCRRALRMNTQAVTERVHHVDILWCVRP